MRLVSYLKDGHDQLAFLVNDKVYDADMVHPELPSSMSMLLNYWDDSIATAQAVDKAIHDGRFSQHAIPVDEIELLSPVPFPSSCRDGYAFRQHVESARRNRGAKMIPEFDQYPVFYFTNHHSVQGPGEIYLMPDHFEKLDFELEVAIVINRQGKNIKAEE